MDILGSWASCSIQTAVDFQLNLIAEKRAVRQSQVVPKALISIFVMVFVLSCILLPH